LGAPRKYAPHGAAEVIKELAIQGHSLTGVASHFKVSRQLVKRWFEDDSDLEEAFEQGREFERKALDDLIKRDAAAGKPANANAMFLLKCRHRYREVDSPKTGINLGVQVASVLVVKDHGTDEQWAAKAAEQQRKLIEGSAHSPSRALATPSEPAVLSIDADPALLYAPPAMPSFAPPDWKQNA
jgi:AcrR family transcriptional regulator